MQGFTRNTLTCSGTLQGMMQLTTRTPGSHHWRRSTKSCLSIQLNRFDRTSFQMKTRILRSKKATLSTTSTSTCCKLHSMSKTFLQLLRSKPQAKTKLRQALLVLLLRVQLTHKYSRSFPSTFCPIIDKKGEKNSID